jgi:hypothetical protein
MDLAKLEALLESERILPQTYSIGAVDRNECYTILFESGSWLVYYSERGHRSSLKQHKTESEACLDFCSRLFADRTTRG